MSILGVGIDLVSIPDFAEQVDQPGTVFAETFTPGERRDAADKSSSAARHLAARWAAKEAVIKAWSGSRFSKRPVLPEGIHRDIEVVTDVTDEDSRSRLRDETLAAFGRVDCVINNAFTIPPMDPITQIEPRKLAKVNETNVVAPLRLSALFADALAESKGSIIMLNSCVVFSSQPEYAGYKLSKGALEHLASSLATELGPRGIRVNSVAPSYIYEDVNRGYFDFLGAVEGKTHEEVYAEKAAPTDLKRLASPQEVARAALFLASDLASAVTGQMLTVDCGEFHD